MYIILDKSNCLKCLINSNINCCTFPSSCFPFYVVCFTITFQILYMLLVKSANFFPQTLKFSKHVKMKLSHYAYTVLLFSVYICYNKSTCYERISNENLEN